jgi:hypothetical protein
MDTPESNTTFEYLLQNCLSTFEQSIKNDMQYHESFECFKDEAEINEWEYEENGTQY